MIIYKVTNKINDKSYIGQTIRNLDKRKQSHLNVVYNNPQFAFHYAIRKYGKENFKWEVLCECDNIDELNEKEKYYIKEYKTFGETGYNMTTGGEGFIMSTKAIEKKSGKNHHFYGVTGKNNPNYGKLSGENNPMYGVTGEAHPRFGILHKKSSIDKMKKNRPDYSGKNNPNYGNHTVAWNKGLTKETDERISKYAESKTGIPRKKLKCPHCDKIGGEGNMQRWHFDNCKVSRVE
tara:strand:- start:4047 stop:4751 length:705 start_codon:yes stop_codon:yes gene_type:complete